ncbi:alpha/beta hydrolase [Curtobacterium aetherium]|uniref:alpha/beta fold hydrolase n=1 Tax=Curtobacterium aetherium TaxID=2841594 RepID=UPI003B52A92C
MTDTGDALRLETTPTQVVSGPAGGIAVRFLGRTTAPGVPLVALTHLGGNLDSFDPEVVNPLPDGRQMVLVGYSGVGASDGPARYSVEDMAADVIAVIRTLRFERIDLLGLSMGGMVAQGIADRAPGLVEHLILAGSGPAGGPGLTRLTGVMVRGILAGIITCTDPTVRLFFTRTRAGSRAAAAYRSRLARRALHRDNPVGIGVFRAQLRAVRRWGDRFGSPSPPAFAGPVLVFHGDSDRMVSASNAQALRNRYPQATVQIFPDSGHGVVFQNRAAVVDATRRFLDE